MAEFVTFVEPGKYEIDFKTDNYEEYRTMKDAARAIVDRCTTPTAADVPAKTYFQDFMESFPDATTNDNVPLVCRSHIYGIPFSCPCNITCEECWNEVMPDA